MRPRGMVCIGLVAGLLSAPLVGCVYYNGMYNANRLARTARKAEREGRPFEANNLWGQVATKAESVMVRHPTSKYAHDAAVLRGVALARLGQCEQAIGPLSRAALAPTGNDLAEDASLATGRCQLMLGNNAAAEAAFGQVLESKDEERRREARFQYARLLRQNGQYEEALEILRDHDSHRAGMERILALAGAEREAEALTLADSLLARNDSTRSWDSLVVVLGSQEPVTASRLVDRIRRIPRPQPEQLARLLLEDGLRLIPVDTARAARRFREAAAAGGASVSSGQAKVALVRMDLKRATQPQQLNQLVAALQSLAPKYPTASEEMNRLRATAASVHSAATTLTQASPSGDLRLFFAAEAARDSLESPRLAELLFRQIFQEWPSSPYAPKAVLAARQLNPDWSDSARILLEERYWDSPYLAVIRGYDTPGYRELEDSLSAFAASLAPPPTPPAPAGRRYPRPPARAPVSDPQPTTGGARLPEPK